MLLLTDCPDQTRELLIPGDPLSGCGVSELAASDARLWQALAPAAAQLAAAHVQPPERAGLFSRLFVVAQAPRSQFDVLRELAEQRLPSAEPLACLALEGHGFHGHRSRPWAALKGNLHLCVSFCLPPAQGPAAQMLPALIMLPAVAVARAVARATSGAIKPAIKWVNDLVVDGRKLAGVLTTTSTRGDAVVAALLGIGVNVAATPKVTPTPFVPAVCSLSELVTATPSLGAVLWLLLSELAELYGSLLDSGPAAIWPAYRAASVVLGKRVRVYEDSLGERDGPAGWPAPLAQGVVASIEPDLSLRLRGSAAPVTKGRLALEEACVRYGI